MSSMLRLFSEELKRLVAQASPAVVAVRTRRGQATGFLLSTDGYVLTNAHVVADGGGGPLRLKVPGVGEMKAERVGEDERTDLAVLRAEAPGRATLTLADTRALEVGELVLAIGNPLHFERSVSMGVVSAVDRSLSSRSGPLEGLIQTDAAINPGNSGGPLLDAEGAVVGINTAVVPYAQGIGFAIPASTASWVTSVLMQKGTVARPFLGVAARGEELEPGELLEAGQRRAVRLLGVGPQTPASSAGLERGDLLLSANGRKLGSVDDLQRVMVLSGEAAELRLEVLRSGKRRELSLRPAPAGAAVAA